jgi:hypothetical protein
MAETEVTARAATPYMLTIKLTDGEELRAEVGEDVEEARAQLDPLQSDVIPDGFVSLGRNTLVRAHEVRYVQLREDDQAETGWTGQPRATVGGERMSTYETQQTSEMGGRRVIRSGGQEQGGPGFADDWLGYGRRPFSETKPFFLTSEFLTFIGAIAAVAIGMAVSDTLDADRGWLLITILATAYMVRRGLAKSGTREPNPRQHRG